MWLGIGTAWWASTGSVPWPPPSLALPMQSIDYQGTALPSWPWLPPHSHGCYAWLAWVIPVGSLWHVQVSGAGVPAMTGLRYSGHVCCEDPGCSRWPRTLPTAATPCRFSYPSLQQPPRCPASGPAHPCEQWHIVRLCSCSHCRGSCPHHRVRQTATYQCCCSLCPLAGIPGMPQIPHPWYPHHMRLLWDCEHVASIVPHTPPMHRACPLSALPHANVPLCAPPIAAHSCCIGWEGPNLVEHVVGTQWHVSPCSCSWPCIAAPFYSRATLPDFLRHPIPPDAIPMIPMACVMALPVRPLCHPIPVVPCSSSSLSP